MNMPFNQLTVEERRVMLQKGTEAPFQGEFDDLFVPGTFICRQCHTPLFSSKAKFEAHCGWPAFDTTFPEAVIETPDADGKRIEISCSHCSGHLGHVFRGELLTQKDTRHCVNSLSLRFIREGDPFPPVLLNAL